ncbi:MAG: CPBP family intramembrane metalloprotease [Deltaproteobacteria bacterium]|nr:CPBP family intramembrane metalloprotease [Deltaproteobacteria bacterium]
MNSLAWDPEALPVVGVLIGCTALFVVLRYRMGVTAWARWVPGTSARLKVSTGAAGVLLRRLMAGLWLGGGALLVETASGADVGVGLALPPLLAGAAWVGWPMLVLVPLLWRSGQGEALRAVQPEIRDAVWTPRLRVLSMAAWVIYLAGYEYLFRGAMLFTLEDAFGAWPAIATTSSIYCLAHLHKPMFGETMGSLFMGILLGAMALATGSFLPAMALHVAIAWTTELSSSS